MKKIPLTQGKFALIDDRDYVRVSKFKWCALLRGRTWYASRRSGRSSQYLHRFILNEPASWVDHKNGNGLDNRRRNLRPATCSQSSINRLKFCSNTSGQTGVDKDRGSWRARIQFRGCRYSLGTFASFQLAAAAYRKATKQLFGEFARI
jgi:hypothetical protein